MEIICTRPGCIQPHNEYHDLDNPSNLRAVEQKHCKSCGMPLILAGRYLPIKLLGKGGFGAAFLAKDRFTPTMRECVVKQFQPDGDLSPPELEIAQELFEREADSLEKFGNDHNQIPHLYAFFPLIVPCTKGDGQDQFFYLVQQFIDGKDLEEELEEKGKFKEADVRHVLEEMLPVLQFVHEKKSIHRDIKPSNIMRDKDGNLFLLDFGAVKHVTVGRHSSSTGIYSPGYAPPEQMTGSRVFPSTDLYALAATCLRLLTGELPEDLYNSNSNEWQWREKVPKVSDRLADGLDKMLQHSPGDRFQSAQEVLKYLKPLDLKTRLTNIGHKSSRKSSKSNKNSLVKVFSSAAFTGVEGAVCYIALTSISPSYPIAIGLWGMSLGGLIYLQYRQRLEIVELLIIAIISLVIVCLIPDLNNIIQNREMAIIIVILASLFGGVVWMALTAIFRPLYQKFSKK